MAVISCKCGASKMNFKHLTEKQMPNKWECKLCKENLKAKEAPKKEESKKAEPKKEEAKSEEKKEQPKKKAAKKKKKRKLFS